MEGNAPSPGTYLAASASLHDDLFTFGGWDDKKFLNALHRLDSKTWRWCQLFPPNAEGAPMPKYGCGMISFGECLGVFGGYGIPRGPTEPQSFIKNTRFTDGGGWTNEFHIFHPIIQSTGRRSLLRSSSVACSSLRSPLSVHPALAVCYLHSVRRGQILAMVRT